MCYASCRDARACFQMHAQIHQGWPLKREATKKKRGECVRVLISWNQIDKGLGERAEQRTKAIAGLIK